MAKKRTFVATVQILIEADNEPEACDAVCLQMNDFSGAVCDWSYLKVGGQDMSHFIKKCKVCLTVMSQCRCMDCGKKVEWGVCEVCGDAFK